MTKATLQKILADFYAKIATIRKQRNKIEADILERNRQSELHTVLQHIHDMDDTN